MVLQSLRKWIATVNLALAVTLFIPSPVSTQQAYQPCSVLGALIRHPTDCGQFFKCDHGGWIPFNCPSTLAFNGQVCDWPQNVPGCGGVSTGVVIQSPTTTNACSSNPCVQGTCVVDSFSPGGWRCECPVGYTGQDCSQLVQSPVTINACSSNPCVQGTCVVDNYSPGGWRCDCPAGYTGQDCSQVSAPAFDPCNPTPCYRGTCRLDTGFPGGWTCDCPAGYWAQDCSQAIGATPSPSCPLYPCPSDVPRHFYPDWDDLGCTSYYACEFGNLQQRQCPQGQQFDLITMVCQTQTNPATAFCSSFRAQNPTV
ncbi:hypothetical protein EGW08_019027 [Elysia chlorotica]|uniref:Chitinase n=1 Tax=Elysia chlorotica TaxID=188477 RepID=A0A433SV92_ELYCH|nr:hypothetical protein EGW08_019027 [Elysia chlorotica]